MNKEDKGIRVVIADDHFIVREGLRLILETDPEMELVGDAPDGASAVRLVGEAQPDVVLMDLRMPGLDDLQAIEQIHAQWPQIALVILTTYHEDALMLRGLQAGACGYLLKDTSQETSGRQTPVPPLGNVAREVTLTEREREVLRGIARGHAFLCLTHLISPNYLTGALDILKH